MGESLADRLTKCSWLGEISKKVLDGIQDIDRKLLSRREKLFPEYENILLSLESIREVPSLVIVGQDPYPDSRATGISFQTQGNVPSNSLDYFARELGLSDGFYPNIDLWVSKYQVLMFNAALCNFGKCGCKETLELWRGFVKDILKMILTLNDKTVVMLLGIQHVVDLLPDRDRTIKCGHPARCLGPSKNDWGKVESKLNSEGVMLHFADSPVPVNYSMK